jgi:hypothetical protein
MARYIGWRNAASPAALEDRVHRLEGRVTALTEAVRVLARGLGDLPTAEPGESRAAMAARQAYDLLLIAEPPATRPDRLPGP